MFKKSKVQAYIQGGFKSFSIQLTLFKLGFRLSTFDF